MIRGNYDYGDGLELTINDFDLFLTSQIINEDLASMLPDTEVGDKILVLTVASRKEEKFTNLMFYSTTDIEFFLDCYIYDCNTLFDVFIAYRSFCQSEQVIKKGIYS